MKWNNHSKDVPEGAHAFLGASKYSWLNYDEEQLIAAYTRYMAKLRGIRYHKLAYELIDLKQKLPRSKKTFPSYVNDAIGFGMSPEVTLYYSRNCFGTADAIGFRNRFLRIHDLKTGVTKSSLHQLEIYAALFCLEYRIKPSELSGCELRIYQNDDILIGNPGPDDILPTMDKIVQYDKKVEKLREEFGDYDE